MGLLQIHDVVVSDEVNEEFRRVRPERQELRVRATVGDSGNGKWRVREFLHRGDIRRARWRHEGRLEFVFDGQVEHRVDGVLARLGREVSDALAHEGLQVSAGGVFDDQVGDSCACAGALLGAAAGHRGAAGVVLRPERRAAVFVLHLGDAFGDAAQGHVAPQRARIEQVPILEGEFEADIAGHGLAEDAEAAGVRALEPVEDGAITLGCRSVLVRGQGHNVVDDRPAAHLREPFMQLESAAGNLDEPPAVLAEHLSKGEEVVVRHHVGDHRGAVVVALDAIGAAELGREAATAGCHSLVQ